MISLMSVRVTRRVAVVRHSTRLIFMTGQETRSMRTSRAPLNCGLAHPYIWLLPPEFQMDPRSNGSGNHTSVTTYVMIVASARIQSFEPSALSSQWMIFTIAPFTDCSLPPNQSTTADMG